MKERSQENRMRIVVIGAGGTGGYVGGLLARDGEGVRTERVKVRSHGIARLLLRGIIS